MLSLLLAATLVTSIQPLRDLPIGPGTDTPQLAYARDDRFEYLGTPNGLYRADRIANTPLELIAFGGEPVNAIAVDGDALYVSKGSLNFALWPEHTLLRSRDRGATFEAIDAGLYDCIVPSECGYLIPRQITFAPRRIFLSAGGNVVVSGDDGATWHVLVGVTAKPTPVTCPVTYERINELLIFGGECPLDDGYIGRGPLHSSLLSWIPSDPPRRVTGSEMENRNVQFIRHLGNGVVYAGIEGALLASTDYGATYRFVLHYAIEGSAIYPYITQMIARPGLLLIGGFDKANERAYLAYSADSGKNWVDISSMVANASIVSLLAEDRDGRLLVATREGDRFAIAQVVVADYRKRRAVTTLSP